MMLTEPELHALHRRWERSAASLSDCRNEEDVTRLLRNDLSYPLALVWRADMRLSAGDCEGACADLQMYYYVGASSTYALEKVAELLKRRPDLANRFDAYRGPFDKLSIPLIVKNEAENLPRFLKSVRDVAHEIVVVDTGSTDETVAIARDFGAKVDFFEWTGDFSAARNYSLSLCSGDWLLWADADEEWTPEARDILSKRLDDPDCQAVTVDRRNVFDDGRQESFPSWTPIWREHPACIFRYPIEEMIDWCIAPLSVRYGRKIAVEPEAVILHYGHGKAEMSRQAKATRNRTIAERRLREQGLADRRALELYVGGLRGEGREQDAADATAVFGLG